MVSAKKQMQCKWYSKNILNIQKGRYTLRSTKSMMLVLVIAKTKFKTREDKSFAAAAAKLWKNLPVQSRNSQDIETN